MPPEDETLPLGFDFRSTVEGAGARLLAIVSHTIDAAGKRGDDFAAELGLDPAQLSRALNGRGAHFSVRWLPAVLWRDKQRHLIRHLCALAGGDFVPRPAMTREQRALAVLAFLEEHGGELGQDAIRRALGED